MEILICITALLVTVLVLRSKLFKNLLGNLKGYGSCPNCGDSWSWKPSGSITYSQNQAVSAGVMICHQCLAHGHLNKEKIIKNLKQSDWKDENIELVKKAMDRQSESEA